MVQKWDKVLDDSNAPFYKWFVGGKTNIVYNCLDRHVATWRRNKLALIWEGENGEVRTFSYHALNREVCKFANVLRSMGVKKGDRVTIYMGRVPSCPSPCWRAPRSARFTRWSTAAFRWRRCTAGWKTASPTCASPATAAT